MHTSSQWRHAGLTCELKHILLLVSAFILTSCADNQGDDLDRFMAEAAQDMRVRVEPLPEVLPYIPRQYNADGILNDPFKPRRAQASSSSAIQPNLNRPREPLEAYPLESLKFVGSIERPKLKYGLIKIPDESVQQVRIGNYMGQNFGIVTDISESGVTLKEIVQDELSGDWVERMTSLELQE
jgi:type IV pilus assembly protein PilP